MLGDRSRGAWSGSPLPLCSRRRRQCGASLRPVKGRHLSSPAAPSGRRLPPPRPGIFYPPDRNRQLVCPSTPKVAPTLVSEVKHHRRQRTRSRNQWLKTRSWSRTPATAWCPQKAQKVPGQLGLEHVPRLLPHHPFSPVSGTAVDGASDPRLPRPHGCLGSYHGPHTGREL